MRVDKFIWCVRYYKTRSLATKMCRKSRVRINGKVVKPSQDVFPTDEITVRKNDLFYKMKVLDFPKSRVGAKKVHHFIHDTTPEESLKKLKHRKESKNIPDKSVKGRPTKKDRRDLDSWFEDLTEDDI